MSANWVVCGNKNKLWVHLTILQSYSTSTFRSKLSYTQKSKRVVWWSKFWAPLVNLFCVKLVFLSWYSVCVCGWMWGMVLVLWVGGICAIWEMAVGAPCWSLIIISDLRDFRSVPYWSLIKISDLRSSMNTHRTASGRRLWEMACWNTIHPTTHS